MNLELDFVDYKIAKYSVMRWHYSRRMPSGKLVKIGVWENSKFIGCVIFGDGILGSTNKFLGIDKLKVAELVRVALDNHITPVTRIIRIAIKLLKEINPNIELLVSFADNGQKHIGIIYQAGNWIYTGGNKTGRKYRNIKTGKIYHDRAVSKSGFNKQMGMVVKCIKKDDCELIENGTIKHRYLMPLTKSIYNKVIGLKRDYIKAPIV